MEELLNALRAAADLYAPAPPLAARASDTGMPAPICNGSHSCAPRPAIIGRFRPAFGDFMLGVRPTLDAPEPALPETDPQSSRQAHGSETDERRAGRLVERPRGDQFSGP